jgi:hypothetical protein
MILGQSHRVAIFCPLIDGRMFCAVSSKSIHASRFVMMHVAYPPIEEEHNHLTSSKGCFLDVFMFLAVKLSRTCCARQQDASAIQILNTARSIAPLR